MDANITLLRIAKLSFASLFLLLISCSWFACNKKQNIPKDLDLIRAANRQFSAHVMEQDYQAVAQTYTADAKLFPPGRNIISGRDSIFQYWMPKEESKTKTIHHLILPEEIKIIDNWAFDYGYYEGTTLENDTLSRDFRGKYQIIWKKIPKGEWKIYTDMWSRAPAK